MHVKKNDTVMILSGKDAGKKGKIMVAMPKENKVIVEGVNMVTKHVRARSAQQPGGLVHQESAIYASKVMLYCGKCNKPTRTGYKFLESGDKVRYCRKCGETFDS